MPTPSKIFTGFRALGFTSNHVPLAVRYHHKHKENYVVTCVGKAFHTYNCSRLGIISVSDSHAEEIQCLAVDAYLVFTGCGNVVQAFTRGKQVIHTYKGHSKPVHLLLPFGQHLLSVDEDSVVKIWDIKSEEQYMEINFDNQTFHVSGLVHPSTYLNKVLFASHQGALQLWNVRTSKLLYTFEGWGAAVTALQQAPAVDVVAIGLSDGRVFLHNIKYDETIVSFTQDWGAITTISFRTDGHPVMATGSSVGHIALWNLEEKKLQSQMRDAHTAAVTGMQCLPNEPLMITSSSDNSIKVWIFDQPDGGGRLLRQRSGHSAPPNCIRFHGNSGKDILSSGQDSTLRSFSTVHDRHNKSLGRASFNKAETKKSGLKHDQHMMPPITTFASDTSRQSDWDNISACHRGLAQVTTWNYQRSTMGAHRLQHPRFEERAHRHTTAQCVTMTGCGNFVIAGYSSGHVDLYNIQSGIHRGSYGKPTAHDSPVRGVAVDSLNQVTATGGADCCLKFWKFKQKTLLESVKLHSQIARIALHRESSMLAVSLDDFSITILDMDTRKVVRKFLGHHNTITDLTFSPDGRWLVTASMDATLRTWDLPTGSMIDCALLDSPVSSLSLSPTGDFLATTHVDDLGVYLWSNMTLYTHVSLRPLPASYAPSVMVMPSTSRLSKGTLSDEELEEEQQFLVSEFKSPDQISDELVTLSLLPNSRWQNLLNLDVIKERNKPKAPPKVPKAAPFFLPTVAGLETKFVVQDTDTSEHAGSRVLTSSLQPLSKFGKLLSSAAETKAYGSVLDALKEMGPSAVDVEIRSLSPDGGGSTELMRLFLTAVLHCLSKNVDFEILQAYLGLFLKLHAETIASEPKLVEVLKELGKVENSSWQQMESLFNQSICLVNYLKSATL